MFLEKLSKFENERIEAIINACPHPQREDLMKLLCEKDIYHHGPSSMSLQKDMTTGQAEFSCEFCNINLKVSFKHGPTP